MQAAPDVLTVTDHTIQSISVEGASLAYIEQGSGTPVVFVHGAITDLRIWFDQVAHFSDQYRAIAYSRRTHWPAQLKDVPEGPYLRSLHANDLIGFLDGLSLKQVHLVGHSFGGSIALLVALERPDLVATLVLGEPSPFLGLFDDSDVGPLSKQRLGFDEAILIARGGNLEGAVRQYLKVIVGADVLDQLSDAARKIVLDNASTLVPMLEHYYESPAISLDSLAKTKVPTLLISGEFSPRLGLISNGKLQNHLPNSTEAVLYSTSHGLHIENPTGFDHVVLKFLAETAAALN